MWGTGSSFWLRAKFSGTDLKQCKLQHAFWGGKKLMSFFSVGHLVSMLSIFSLVMLPVIRQLWIFKTSLSNSYATFQACCVQLMTSPAPKQYFLHRHSTCLEAKKKRVSEMPHTRKPFGLWGRVTQCANHNHSNFSYTFQKATHKANTPQKCFQEIFYSPGIKITFTLLFLVEQLFLNPRCVLD